MNLTLAALALTATSYFEWYLARFETAMVYPFDATYTAPSAAGETRLSETRLTTEDGEELVVWRAAAAPGRPTILYFPGNAGALKDRTRRFTALIDRGYGVVALAYRGSSGSTGTPDEALLTADARRLARAEAASPLILYGESLGTGIAIKLASEGIGQALVLEAPFTSIADVLAAQYPSEDMTHLLTQKWDSAGIAAAVTQPLVILHGNKDKIVPIAQGRALFSALGSAEKSFHEVDGRGHQGLWTADMQRALFAFLDAR